MTKQYWSVGKPGYVWLFLDEVAENQALILELQQEYPVTSEYSNGHQKRRLAVTFEVPTEKIPKGFERLD